MMDDIDTATDPDRMNRSSASLDDTMPLTSPYETDPALLPKDDPYLSRSVHYGRYGPREDDFKPIYSHWYQPEPNTVSYWEGVMRKFCTEENSLNLHGSRDAFAAGSVIIRIDREDMDDEVLERYSCINANELSSSRRAESALKDAGVTVPVILFCGPIGSRNVTIESRIPGVSLEVAWRYLTTEQINMLKRQCRCLIQRLATVDSISHTPSYVCSKLNAKSRPDIQTRETEILFEGDYSNENLCMTHNDMVRPNIIVRDDRVVGITGWRQSGFFGYKRAKRIHQELRIPEPTFISSGGEEIGEPSWADIYDDLSEATTNSANTEEEKNLEIKTEPSTVALDEYPANDGPEYKKALFQLDGGTESRPTPKQVTNLKRDSRASSITDGTPTTTLERSVLVEKKGRRSTKKGTAARKPAGRKRRAGDHDDDAVDDSFSSAPPSRTSRTPGLKKQSSASITSSPAPESALALEDNDEASHEDTDEQFCICRRPDNHTWMIGCDGGCEDWFHGKCVSIDSKDAELIERYICPNCSKNGKGRTSWKPMCRLSNCRRPARVSSAERSKYCSDEHGREFMRQHLDFASGLATRKATASTRKGLSKSSSNYGQRRHQTENEGLGRKGGVLTIGELKAIVTGVSSAQEFRKLGNHIVSPSPEPESPEEGERSRRTKSNEKLGLSTHPKDVVYTTDELLKLEMLRKRRDELSHRKEMLETRNNFIGLVRQRAKSILEYLRKIDPKGGWKDICGFDSRLAWSDEEFDDWRLSEAGRTALKDGTPEGLAASYPSRTDADGDTAMDDGYVDKNDLDSVTRGVCTKKRCERHKQWVKVQQQDVLFEGNDVDRSIVTCEAEVQIVMERAVLRMWAEEENAHVNDE